MHRGAIRQLFAGSGQHFLEKWLSLVELVLLQGAQAGFIILQRLRDPRILGDSCFFRGSFLSHVKNFSCARRNNVLLNNRNAKSEYPSITQREGEGQLAEAVLGYQAPSCEQTVWTLTFPS